MERLKVQIDRHKMTKYSGHLEAIILWINNGTPMESGTLNNVLVGELNEGVAHHVALPFGGGVSVGAGG
ncbi:hypothetical protein OsI_17811 [Oryza sativa Indica Group]|uniref:Uncharacterized protein n=2 Tax=Oryza sativa TaxID=4530 RepID=A3AGI1_ORYSJ|nr:hypothetical protein OsI_17811 [Oryza sativa Indica Group]EAZ26420.1 hypothetical protein OsJ_10305 [Oryza sativa Japonica Group]